MLMIDRKYALLPLLMVGLVWLRSSFGKFTSGNFEGGLGKILEKFASNNPYPGVKEFLTQIAIPNSQTFAMLVLWGELLVALSVIMATLSLLFNWGKPQILAMLLLGGLTGGMLLNLVFWLAAGWTSPSTDTVNLLMLAIQLLGWFWALRLLKS